MRLALTGGGTGGHVFPALEVGRIAAATGDEVHCFGSHRGQEGKAAAALGIPFSATQACPIPKLMSLGGFKAVMSLLKSTKRVRAEFLSWRPDVLFATGGYSSGPSLRAARSLKIPIVLHEQNSIPGRGTSSMAGAAAKICIVFEETRAHFPDEKVVATGMPVRQMLVEASQGERHTDTFTTLVSGGSQGARKLNEAVISAACDDGRWVHITGPKLYNETRDMLKFSNYRVVPFLEADAMADVLGEANLAIVRAGCGTIAELALFGVPAIFVPLPTSFADHQLHNARAIERIGGGAVLEQKNLTQQALATEWRAWRNDQARRDRASAALRSWAKPEAAQHVLEVVRGAAK